MSETPRHDTSRPLDAELSLRGIIGFAVGLTVVVAIAAVAMWFSSGFLKDRIAASDPPPPALPEARQAVTPPGPALQTDPQQDLAALRTEEDDLLTTYGWIDEGQGLARVPVEVAIQLELEAPSSPPAAAEDVVEDGVPSAETAADTPADTQEEGLE